MFAKLSMGIAAGAMALSLSAPQAQAGNRNAEIAAGIIFGAVAGAMIAGAASNAHANSAYVYEDTPRYRPPVYVRPRRIYQEPVQYYEEPRSYSYSEPLYETDDDYVIVKKRPQKRIRKVIVEEYLN